jgi:hypothetical protein
MEHPFVLEARDLAVRAIETGDPGRFIWIDESGVATTVGSASKPRDGRRGPLWIPASAGWTALDGRAQQLVADVLLLLNLAERGAKPADRERRLQRARRNDLPPCLSEDRRHLDPGRTVGMVKRSPPGSNCRDGCAFDLCPYPPKGEQPYRVELSEAFCRRQQQLLDRRSARTAPWQAALAKELKAFWIEMEQRARR